MKSEIGVHVPLSFLRMASMKGERHMNADLAQLIAVLPHDDSPEQELQRIIPTGRLARLWTLGTMQAQIAAAYGAMWVRSFFGDADANARQLVETHMATAMRLV